MSGDSEDDLIAMLLADENANTAPEIVSQKRDDTHDRREDVVPAPAHIIKDLSKSKALNEWLVVKCGGQRHRKGRLVKIDGGRVS